jgi:hypothetical protein
MHYDPTSARTDVIRSLLVPNSCPQLHGQPLRGLRDRFGAASYAVLARFDPVVEPLTGASAGIHSANPRLLLLRRCPAQK